MLSIHHLTYQHPNKDILFSGISWQVSEGEHVALIGNNGAGKSTLLKVIAGKLGEYTGSLILQAQPYYVPQHFGQYDHLTVAEALGIVQRLEALGRIRDGSIEQSDFDILNEDWMIEERCAEALEQWGLKGITTDMAMSTLSGGQKTKVFLSGITIHAPKLILLDEPGNHLDLSGRQQLSDWMRHSRATILLVSHDRTLLNQVNKIGVLTSDQIQVYGGNYDFYATQKQIAHLAMLDALHEKEKALKKAKEKERETIERQQKLENRGRKKQVQAGVPRIMLNTLKNNAEKTSSKLKSGHHEKIGSIAEDLHQLRSTLPQWDQIKLGFGKSDGYEGKRLVSCQGIKYHYPGCQPLWHNPLALEIFNGDRMAIRGDNGSGKSTLIKLLLGELQPAEGSIHSAATSTMYIDQDYRLIDDQYTVHQQAQIYNSQGLKDHEVNILLSRFLFPKSQWDKPCAALSGGERMRLMLCCMSIKNQAPELLILDEPTNNLDIQNIEILTEAILNYRGALVVISHDEVFLKHIEIQKYIDLDQSR